MRLFSSATVMVLSMFALPPFNPAQAPAARPHNVIIFVADGLRRGSVTAADMPTFLRVRTEGVDFRNSHSVFPTFTTANASAIATGHGLGDTGDFSNTVYPGLSLAKPDPALLTTAPGQLTPFLENDEILADMNSAFHGNYLGERTLLSVAADKGFNVASIGKLGPTAIQLNDRIGWTDFGTLTSHGATVIDDSTGPLSGLPLTPALMEDITKAGLLPEAPARTNGYAEASQGSNGFSGDATTPGTLDSNRIQQQWFADIATKVLLPKFAAEEKPFLLLFWSRDPDGTQHNEGDSLQNLAPGINGDTTKKALRNADHDLKQLLDFLDAHPSLKATTDVLLTSDHGFATISRREIDNGKPTGEPSAFLPYDLAPREKPQPPGTLPTGMLAIDLGIRMHMRVFDPAVRATAGGSIYGELVLDGEHAHHPSSGSALLGDAITRIDGSDAKLIVAANGGSDLIYAPKSGDGGKDADLIHNTISTLAQLDYVGGVFVDDAYCPAATACPGALPLSAIGLVGRSDLPRPAIVVTYEVFYPVKGDLQSAAQVSDTTLQQGQGMHGGFGREQTWNNMAAIGPDFKKRFIDEAPVGNIDIVPTLAKILGIDMPSTGTLRGRVAAEAIPGGAATSGVTPQTLVSAPATGGLSTVLQFQESNGVRYLDRACMTSEKTCP